jgi:hypothetical protein
MMTYLEKDVLPFPHVKGIDLGPAMKRKVFFILKTSFSWNDIFSIRILPKKNFFIMPMNFLCH